MSDSTDLATAPSTEPAAAPTTDLNAALADLAAEVVQATNALEGEITTEGPREVNDIGSILAKVALADTLKALVSSRVDDLRVLANDELLAVYRATNAKSFGIHVEGLGKVGTASIPETEEVATVTDAKAYAAYVETHHPDEVEYTLSVKAAFQKAHLKGLALDHSNGVVVDANGEIVPGLKPVAGGKPKSMRVTLSKKTELADLVASLDAATLLGAHGDQTPALTGGTVEAPADEL